MVKQMAPRLSSEKYLVICRVGKFHHYSSLPSVIPETSRCQLWYVPAKVTSGAKPQIRGSGWNRIPLENPMLSLQKLHGK